MATSSEQAVDANKIQLEIVTPRGAALKVSADEVTAPSVDGEFGVMPGHLPLLAAIRTGLVTYRQGSETKKCAVGPGFAEAGANKLLILTDEFIERAQVDPVLVRKELAEIEAELTKAEAEAATTGEAPPGSTARGSGGADPQKGAAAMLHPLIKRENWLAAQLELYGDPPPATMRPFEQYGPPAPPDESEIPVADSEDTSA